MNISISKNFYDISIIPKNWTEKRLKNILSISENKSSNFNNEKILSLTKKGIVINDITSNKGQIAESYEKYIKVKKGQICMNPMDLLSGWVDISNFEGLISPAYYTFELNKEVENKFINYFLQSNYLRKTFFKLGKGVASHGNFGRWVLTPEELKNICLFIPNIDEQKLISCYLDKKTTQIDSLISKIEKKIELLKEQRISLINQYVTKGLEPNVEMKDSGVEWIGEMPNHWVVKKLPWVCYFQEGPGLRNWEFTENGVPVVCVTNIKQGGLTFEKYQRYIAEEEYNLSYKHFTVEAGDLLMASSGNSFGKICSYDGEFDFRFILNTSTIRLHSLDENQILTSYIKLIVQSEIFQNQIRILITGAAQPNFGPTHLSQIRIPIPPIDEQKSILLKTENTISNVEKMIDKEICRINLLVEYQNSLISSIVTGKVRVTEDMV